MPIGLFAETFIAPVQIEEAKLALASKLFCAVKKDLFFLSCPRLDYKKEVDSYW